MGVALKLYVEENQARFPFYLGPPGPAYGDEVFPGDRRGTGKGCVFWSTKLFPYYPLNWTNAAFHCPAYKGVRSGPVPVTDSGVTRLGSYAYNTLGAGTKAYTKYLGWGPS